MNYNIYGAKEPFIYIGQDVSRPEGKDIYTELKTLNPQKEFSLIEFFVDDWNPGGHFNNPTVYTAYIHTHESSGDIPKSLSRHESRGRFSLTHRSISLSRGYAEPPTVGKALSPTG